MIKKIVFSPCVLILAAWLCVACSDNVKKEQHREFDVFDAGVVEGIHDESEDISTKIGVQEDGDHGSMRAKRGGEDHYSSSLGR